MISGRLEKYRGPDKFSVICYALMSFLTGLTLAHGDTTLYPLLFRKLYLYFILVCLFIALYSSISKHSKLTVGIAAPFIYFSYEIPKPNRIHIINTVDKNNGVVNGDVQRLLIIYANKNIDKVKTSPKYGDALKNSSIFTPLVFYTPFID